MFAAQRANLKRGQAVTRDGRPWLSKLGEPAVTVEQAAREAGADITTVGEAKRVLREAAPEVVQAVAGGKLTIHKAAAIAREVPRALGPVMVLESPSV